MWDGTECIESSRKHRKDIYGHVYVDGIRKYAHRHAWEQANGPIPDGMHVLHRCDNPPCRNAKHLFLGTAQDNMDDKVSKGRQRRGELHGYSKLTELDVSGIRDLCRKGEMTQVQIGSMYGVSQACVSHIAGGSAWGWMGDYEDLKVKPKISESQVREIRALSGKMRQVDIAKLYGIQQAQVSKIVLRHCYGSI